MSKSRKTFIFIISYLAYTSTYIARLNLTMAENAFETSGILDKASFGLMGSVFFVVYSIGRIVNGRLGDRFKPYVMVTSGLLLCTAANITIGFMPPVYAMMILWGANAFAQSALWGALVRVMSEIYGEKAKKKTSILITSTAAGNIIGILLSTLLLENIGLGAAFIVPGTITLVMGILSFFVLKEVKSESKEEKKPASFLSLLSDKNLIIMLIPTFLHGVIKDNINMWMAAFFGDTYGIDLKSVAAFVLFIPLTTLAGRLLYMPLYKLMRENENTVAAFAFVLCAVSTLPLWLIKSSASVSLAALCLISASVSLINTTALSMYPLNYAAVGGTSTVSGIMDFATYMGAGVGSAVYGFVLNDRGGRYATVYLSWAVIALISFVIMSALIKRAANKNS